MNSADAKQLQKLLRLLTTAATNASLYQIDHLQVQRLCRQTLQEVNSLLGRFETLTFKVVDGRLIFANQPVSQSLPVQRLLRALQLRGISHLQIEAGVYAEELLGLVGLLSKRRGSKTEICDSEHIQYGQVTIRRSERGRASEAAFLQLAQIADDELDKFMEIYETVRTRQQLNVGGINEIVSSFINAFSSHGEAFLAIAPLRSMDEYTYTHSTNICLLNLAQARLLGIEGPLLNDIGVAAMLHDVGKMFISPQILNKRGALDEQEWEVMRQHPLMGAEYLLGTPGVPRLAVITAFEHHMRFDGAGYPKTARPWQQNLCSYMTAISDTYDAMRTHRSYEESLSLPEITDIMLNLTGEKLHPQLTYGFLQVLNKLESRSQQKL